MIVLFKSGDGRLHRWLQKIEIFGFVSYKSTIFYYSINIQFLYHGGRFTEERRKCSWWCKELQFEQFENLERIDLTNDLPVFFQSIVCCLQKVFLFFFFFSCIWRESPQWWIWFADTPCSLSPMHRSRSASFVHRSSQSVARFSGDKNSNESLTIPHCHPSDVSTAHR